MPKTKKPRKVYDPNRWPKAPRRISAKDVSEIKAEYRNVELAVELLLHTGAFTKDDLLSLGSIKTFKERALRTGSFAVTGDELKAIRNGIEIAGTFIRIALDKDPRQVIALWILTEMSGDMPENATEGLKWMDKKLKEIHRRLR